MEEDIQAVALEVVAAAHFVGVTSVYEVANQEEIVVEGVQIGAEGIAKVAVAAHPAV